MVELKGDAERETVRTRRVVAGSGFLSAFALQLTQPLAQLRTRDRPLFLRSFAAAHAESGNFKQAAAIVRQSLKELGSNSHPLKDRLLADLRRYEAGEPVRISAVADGRE